MTLANDVKAKLAFQPDDVEQVTLGLVELEQAVIAWVHIDPTWTDEKTKTVIEAYWADYLANGLTPNMPEKALLMVAWQ